jgi:hypothetical protein
VKRRRLVLIAIPILVAGCSVSSIDASTSKALDACEKIKDEAVRANCIVRVAEMDKD